MAAAILGAACHAPREPAREPVILWRTVGTWSGDSLLQTDSFISETGLFRVRWESHTRPEQPPATLRVTLHSAVSGRALVTAVEHEGSGRDTAIVSEDPREFFLVIDGRGLAWMVTLDEGIRTTRAREATP